MSLTPLPQLRNLDVFPLESNGRLGICLQDPNGLAPDSMVFYGAAGVVLSLMLETQSLEELQARASVRTGQRISRDFIQKLLEQLQAAYFLEGPHFQERRQEILAEYASLAERPARLAGLSYPEELAELIQFIEGNYLQEKGPGRLPGVGEPQRVRGLIAPHVDPLRGGPFYAQAYQALSRDPSLERIIILGTGHEMGSKKFVVGSQKDFSTPLGSLATDVEFLENLQGHLVFDLFDEQLLHRNEHSIEFQTVYLAHLFAGKRTVRIVPLLCGSFHRFVSQDCSPRGDAVIESVVSALQQCLEETPEVPTCLLGAVDLSHLGPRYGDLEPVSPQLARDLERADRNSLAHVLRGDAESFYQSIAIEDDSRRVCGLSALYLLLRCLEEPHGELLGYGQAADQETGSVVSFASAVFR